MRQITCRQSGCHLLLTDQFLPCCRRGNWQVLSSDRCSIELHWIGAEAGLVFLFASVTSFQSQTGSLCGRNPTSIVMLILTLVSQFAISPKMAALGSLMGTLIRCHPINTARVQFNALHRWSTRLELAYYC